MTREKFPSKTCEGKKGIVVAKFLILQLLLEKERKSTTTVCCLFLFNFIYGTKY